MAQYEVGYTLGAKKNLGNYQNVTATVSLTGYAETEEEQAEVVDRLDAKAKRLLKEKLGSYGDLVE